MHTFSGAPGETGAPGQPGAPGMPGVDFTSSISSGAVYTRWGKTTCRENSTLIYAGLHNYI